MIKQHYKFIFRLSVLIALCCFQLSAQNQPQRPTPLKAAYSEEFVYNARQLYDWNILEKEMQNQLHIDGAELNLFLVYAAKKNLLDITPYLEKVKAGTVTKANATQYWINQLPVFEKLYQKEKNNLKSKPEPIVNSPSATCNNLDFTSGTTGWTGRWCGDPFGGGSSTNYSYTPANLPVAGLNSSGTNQANYVHELMTAGTDPYVPVSRVPPGHTSSLRLGSDEPISLTAFYPFNHQVISNTFTVSPANPAITYWYAVVFDQAKMDAHLADVQPYFKIRLFDKDGKEIKCASYDVNITDGTTPTGGFKTLPISGTDVEAVYRDWVQIYIPLINNINEQVTIQFESSDCAQGGHFGYAYLAVDCNPFKAITTSPFICGSSTAQLTAPAGSNSYVWTGPGVVPPNNTQTITVNQPGKYTVTMSVVGNNKVTCTYDLDTTITGNSTLPVANFSSTVVCAGSTTNFTDMSTPAGSITEWAWDFNNDGVTDSNIPNPTHIFNTPGTFPVKLTVKQGPCDAKITKNVIVETPPLLVITNPGAVCSPNTIDITLAGVTSGSTAGTLTYWTDAAATVPLTNPQAVATAGTYYIKLTPASAPCPAIKPVVVKFNIPPTLVITDPPAVCNPNTVNITDALVTAGSSPGVLTYWEDANATVPLSTPNSISVSGTYYIKLTSAAGCINIQPVKVNTNSLPNALAGPDVTICSGVTTAMIGSTPVNGYSYEWTPTSGLTNPNIANPGITTTNNGTTPIKTTYTLTTIVTATGCKAVDNVDVIVNPQPVLVITNPAPVCTPLKVDLTAPVITANSTAIASGTLSYWTDAAATTPLSSPNAVGVSGTYYIKVVVAGGCEDIKPVTMVINPLPASNAGPDVLICTGDVGTLGGTAVSNYTYSWSPLTGLSSGTISNPTVTLTNVTKSPISTLYIVTTTNTTTGCTSTDTVKVTVNSVPTVNAGSVKSVCPGSTVQLEGSIGGSASGATWSGGTGTFADKTSLSTVYTPSAAEYLAGTVTLTLTTNDPDGPCTFASSDVILTFYKNPVVNYGADKKEGCPRHCVNFSDSSYVPGAIDIISKWSWNFGDPTSGANNISALPNPLHCYDTPGYYDIVLTVTSNHGCTSVLTTPKMIHVFEIPVAEFTPTPNPASVLDPRVTLVNGSSADVVYWNYHFGDGDSISPSTPSPSHLYPDKASTTYTATLFVKNADGCTNYIEHLVEIGPEFTFYIPNAFTPDGDGTNDFFFGTGIGIVQYDLTIFDRWGNLIFHSEKLQDQWNGKANNGDEISQQDVFVWKVKLTDVFGKKHHYMGTVTLVK